MLGLTKSRKAGKRLFIFLILFVGVFFTNLVVAQGSGSPRTAYEVSIPEKIQKLVLDPLPAGTYTIGTGGSFAAILDAFNKLETVGHPELVSGS